MAERCDVRIDVDLSARPCACLGYPTECVWSAPGVRFLIGYRCSRCGHEWPHDGRRAKEAVGETEQ